ncbi:VCBS repeat-containing protein [uncultured Paraglaciecola sp.]|uniref:FG-GAP repeat domain-containing protein n=1 Tax=uncultured Paraglaciecola sp. TaxID=1765024 RepID=UPI0030D782D5|tara:strand:+ start:41825 stop:43348 length:1524 start_codon:yes stop_codon:yes gene_type:complete
MVHFFRRFFLFISFGLWVFQANAKNTDIFTQQQIDLSFNVNQAVLIADLLPHGGKELVVVGVNDKQQRMLVIYFFDTPSQTFIAADQIEIPNTVFAYDVGEPLKDGLQRLYLLDKTTVSHYVPAHLSHKSAWVQAEGVSSMFIGDKPDTFQKMDFVQDLNHDGLDDIVLPHFEQLNLWLSDCCGARHPQSLPIAARIEMYESGIGYDDHELYFQDMNADGKSDLVTVEQGQLNVFLQNDDMRFSDTATKVKINHTIYPWDWWDIKAANGQKMDQSNIQHRVVRKIDDLNGDGIPDIAVQFTKSTGVLDKIIDFEFFYGALDEGKVSYPQQANSSVTSEETLSDIIILDIDMDGKKEVSVSSFDIGISQIIGALLSGSIDQDVLIFSMDEKGQYGKKPFVRQEVEMTFSLSSGARGQPLVKMIDVNGDSVKDIVYSDDDDLIRIVFATPDNKKPYAKRSQSQKVAMPKNPFDAATDDINGDGKTDIVLHHGYADSPELLKRIIVLLAN